MYKIKDAANLVPGGVTYQTLHDWIYIYGVLDETNTDEVCDATENPDGSGRKVKHITDLGIKKLVLFCVFRHNNPDLKISEIVCFFNHFVILNNQEKVEHLEKVKQNLIDQHEYIIEFIDNELDDLFKEEE